MLRDKKPTINFHHKNETHRATFLRFLILIIILVAYFLYMSWKYDAHTGLSVSILTWSFFVLCTPIADGGFILAFPIRLLFKIKMTYTQIVLWFVAIGINIFYFTFSINSYDLTFMTELLKHILAHPYPYWGIIIISACGTFLSIFFGDEMVDVASHKARKYHHKHKLKHLTIVIFGLTILTIVAYYYLLGDLNIVLPE